MTEPHEHEHAHLSVIKIVQRLEERLAKINTYPLNPDNLIIQQDAYERLAGESEESEEPEAFAILEQARKEKDSDLRFMVQLTEYFAVISIESLGDIPLDYASLGKDEKAAADQIVLALTMLANGQLSCVHTARNGRLCAVELVYTDASTSPVTISIDGQYPRFIRRDSPDDYEVHALKNNYDIPRATMPERFFLRASLADGSPLNFNRNFVGRALTPLTKTEYAAIINTVGNTLAGAENDDEFAKKVNGSWMPWFLWAILCIPIFIWVPDNIFSYVAPIAGLVAFLIAVYFAGHYVIYLENLRRSQPDHVILRIDETLNFRNIIGVMHTASLLGTGAALLFPIYVTKEAHQLVTYQALTTHISPLILIPVAFQIIAFLLSLFRKRILRGISGAAGLIGVIGVLIVNFGFTYTGEDIATPEPQTTIAVISFIVQLVASTIVLAIALKKTPAELQSSIKHTSQLPESEKG